LLFEFDTIIVLAYLLTYIAFADRTRQSLQKLSQNVGENMLKVKVRNTYILPLTSYHKTRTAAVYKVKQSDDQH